VKVKETEMKYIKFIAKDDRQCAGVFNSDGTIQLIKGDILGEHGLTDAKCDVDDVKEYLVPVEVPNIMALGLNYTDHANESRMDLPSVPLLFLKATTSLTAHQSHIILPKEAPAEVDFEAELGVIIGKKARNISTEQVAKYIFGYTCANDVSARDCQLHIDKQWARGKSFDTFAPVGPVIETELDTADIRIKLFLNGKCMQDASTKDMIFSVADTVSFLSRNMTLLPGTLIMTGTPPGVGFARKPPVFLKQGDKVVVQIEGIGSLENTVVSEQSGDG
jgi:2-keto-4-pentenoate hydratase/2-oxohepta-3-ene-1,7-dioic acid hydratase in catechol pathway